MKKYIVTSLLLLVPFMSMAADRCTDPDRYTIDRRCYVTDEQKKEKPYNATVYLIESGCTGTIIKFKNGLYVYTAKHCVVDKSGAVPYKIKIRTQSGTEFIAQKNKIGNFDTVVNPLNRSGDWAIYSIPSSYQIASTDFTDNQSHGWDILQLIKYDAQVIGYGVLKIMSDKEISNYKDKYIKYLKDKKWIVAKGDEGLYGFDGEGGVRAYYGGYGGPYVVNFLEYLAHNDGKYYYDVFGDKKLKVSQCKYSAQGQSVGCQIWGGNSGGGVFDKNGNLMGILAGYDAIIGGKNHAAASSVMIHNVDFLK